MARISYAELLERVARLAGALAARGVGKGDRVIVYMPMVPEALVAMLACARLGAIHSVVFGGFAAHELAVRIDDAAAEGDHRRLLRHRAGAGGALQAAGRRRRSSRRGTSRSSASSSSASRSGRSSSPGRDLDWHAAQEGVAPAPCTPVGGMDPLYILYTSGTTGQPKGVVRTNAGHMVALAWSMRNIYAVEPGEVFWAASDVGWVVGHSYICYAPLLVGATTIVFEGKPVGHARRRHLLAGDRRARGQELLHRADRLPRDQARGSRRASW